MNTFRHILFLLILAAPLLPVYPAYAQKKKTPLKNHYKKGEKAQPNLIKRALKDLYDQSYNSMKTDPRKDSIGKARQLINAQKSEKALEPYEGKVIRTIYVESMGFEQVFTDSNSRIKYWGTRLLNQVHTDTREWVIRNNLFIKKNDKFSAYKVSDNERHLRSLGFIQDARIVIMPSESGSDSVDLLVITKDVFSLSGIVDADATTARVRAGDDNLFGWGQSLRATMLYDLNRNPRTGYEVRYSKNNICGTFVNADIGYSMVNNGVHVGIEQEDASYLRLSRPLISPYSHLVGGLELSSNTSVNTYGKSDSLFYSYHYNYYNAWAGYNLANHRFLEKYTRYRKREFLALRYMNTHFSSLPFQVGEKFDPLYNNKQAILGSLTLFEEDFYKTSYIYGFGTTEDVPIGYNINATSGWYRQNNLNRAYAGISLNYFEARPNGYFAQYYLRFGTFFNKGPEDITFLAGIDAYSPLVGIARTKMRQFVRVSYSRLDRRLTYAPLKIDNTFGIRDFNSDSLWGKERINLNTDLVLYTRYKIFGFRMAPFLYSDFVWLRPEPGTGGKPHIYTGIGGGLRIRNDNFVFGTIEARCIYFPETRNGADAFKININSELRYRYRTDYVRMPDIIQLNDNLY